MKVKVYNKETKEYDIFENVKEIHCGRVDFVLEEETGRTRLFEYDMYNYIIL